MGRFGRFSFSGVGVSRNSLIRVEVSVPHCPGSVCVARLRCGTRVREHMLLFEVFATLIFFHPTFFMPSVNFFPEISMRISAMLNFFHPTFFVPSVNLFFRDLNAYQ